MSNWDFSPPSSKMIDDHGVTEVSNHLKGKHISVLVTGGIAAMKIPSLVRALRKHGALVSCVLSKSAKDYLGMRAIEWAANGSVITELTSDSEHLGTKIPVDAYLVAPATYNTINKFALGIADTVVTTTLATALGRLERGEAKIVICPTMHGLMHNSILTDSMLSLSKKGVLFIKPRDEFGKHNLPSSQNIVYSLIRHLSKSPLKGEKVLLTSGHTPVPVDQVRRIVARFKGGLGQKIALELWLRGANLFHVFGSKSEYEQDRSLPFKFIPAPTFEDYLHECMKVVREESPRFAVLSAAVADYQPREVRRDEKIKSGILDFSLTFKETPKVVDRIIEEGKKTQVISFKYEVGKSEDELVQIARSRIAKGHQAVVVNHADGVFGQSHQAQLVASNEPVPVQLGSKDDIARGLADYMESLLKNKQ